MWKNRVYSSRRRVITRNHQLLPYLYAAIVSLTVTVIVLIGIVWHTLGEDT